MIANEKDPAPSLHRHGEFARRCARSFIDDDPIVFVLDDPRGAPPDSNQWCLPPQCATWRGTRRSSSEAFRAS